MTITCRSCGQTRSHRRRGLCKACYRLHTETGTLYWFPPLPHGKSRTRMARLENFRELAEQREHRELIASRLAVSVRTVQRYEAATRNEGAA